MDNIQVTHNNDNHHYRIAMDIAKEGSSLWDLTPYVKGRVGDNRFGLQVTWTYQGQLMNIEGMKPYIEGNVGQYSVDDKNNLQLDPNCGVVRYVGDPADCQAGGQATYYFPEQMFPKEGIFKGYIGLLDDRDDSKNPHISGVTVWFKVLPGIAEMGHACDYYISDLEKALVDFQGHLDQHDKDYDQKLAGKISEFDNKTNEVIDDARNTYMAETKDAHDSLDALKSEIRANRAEQENLTNHLAGTEQQIEIHDIPTRPEFEAQNARIDEKLDSMNLNIESYKDLDAVKAKYPNGSSNLIVTNDGYRAVWDGTEWVKGSAFVAAELKDKAVVPTKVSNVAIDQIADDAIDWNNLKKWPIDTAPITLTPNNDGTFNLANQVVKDDKDHGFIFKVSASSLHDTFYFNIYHEPLAANNTNSVEIYLFNANGNLANKIISETNSDKNYSSYAFQKKFFGAYLIDDTFSFLLVLHDSDQIKMRLSVSNIPGFHQLSNIEKK